MDAEQQRHIPDRDWAWAPYAPEEADRVPRFAVDEWAPASTVRRPWLRLGRWTLLYRRAA